MKHAGKIRLLVTIALITGLLSGSILIPEAIGKELERSVTTTPSPSAQAPALGEASGPVLLNPSNTVSIEGDLAENMSNFIMNMSGSRSFATDIRIRSLNTDSIESNQSMACDENGNFYVAWEDTFLGPEYIQIYRSQDGGLTWAPVAALVESDVALTQPSITVAEGSPNRILVTYIRDDGVNPPVPEVAIKDLASGSFTIHSVPVWGNWEAYRKPVIWTDSTQYHAWYAYITCEGVYDSAAGNVNVVVYRSSDGGETWDQNVTVFGNTDTDEWIDPDGCFGTTKKRNFVVCYNNTNKFLYWGKSVDDGVSWDTMWFQNMTEIGIPYHPVDPEIEASVDDDILQIAATRLNDYTETIGFAHSPSAGDTFSSLHNLFPQHQEPRYAASLHANQGGNSYHLAYTSQNKVYYSSRPQDLSVSWDTPVRIDDAGYASNVYDKKGLASVWDTDVPGIVWADYRDGSTLDYDSYFETTIKRSFSADKTTLSAAAGGTVKFWLDAGFDNANRTYIILLSASGTWPGTTLPGGKKLPVNWDALTDLGFALLNSPVLVNFYDQLDYAGRAMAYLWLPPIPGNKGVTLCFAYTLKTPYDFVSNPWTIDIVN